MNIDNVGSIRERMRPTVGEVDVGRSAIRSKGRVSVAVEESVRMGSPRMLTAVQRFVLTEQSTTGVVTVAVALIGAMCGEPTALSTKVRVAEYVRAAVGVKVRVILQ
jgi:hypothetical protein